MLVPVNNKYNMKPFYTRQKHPLPKKKGNNEDDDEKIK